MYKIQNGWTKEKMKEAIRAGNNGKKSRLHIEEFGQSPCAYRGSYGNKCGAGCFIPDELYSTGYENIAIHDLMDRYPDLSKTMPLDNDGMRMLQTMHDHASDDELDHDMRDDLCYWIDFNVEE